jgi:hypothetical protein
MRFRKAIIRLNVRTYYVMLVLKRILDFGNCIKTTPYTP